MQGFSLNAKLVGEARTDSIDISAALGPLDVPASAAATVAVYTGTDPSPSSLLGALTVDTVYNRINLPLLAAGVAGCIYQLVVVLTLTSGAQKTFTAFLAVVPDAV